MKETLIKGLSSGLVAGIATTVLFGDAGTINFFDMALNPSIVSGVAVAAGSVASDMISENIIERMNLPQNVVSIEENLIRFGISGAASAGVLMASGVPMGNVGKAILLGGASKFGGDYAYEKILSPKTGMLPLF